MSDIVLSGATRANLLALQNTTSLQGIIQNRLATGKKVNSALDNATNFFTAANFTNRSTALTSLMDSMSTSVQTLQAANNGITSITKLVAQLRSTAQQAMQTTGAYTSTAKIASTSSIPGATAADVRGAKQPGFTTSTAMLSALTPGGKASGTSTNTLAGANLDSAVKSSATSTNAFSTLDSATKATATGTNALAGGDDTVLAKVVGTATSMAAFVSGDTAVAVNDGTAVGTKTFTFDSSATSGDAFRFRDLADLNAKMKAAGLKATAEFDAGNTNKLTFRGSDGSVGSLSVTEINGPNAAAELGTLTPTGATQGKVLTLNDGTTTKSLTYDTHASADDLTRFKNTADLNAKLGKLGIKAVADEVGGKLRLTATDTQTSLTVTGSAATAIAGLTGLSPGAGDTLLIDDGTTGKNFTFDEFATDADTDRFKDVTDLNKKLARAGIKITADLEVGKLKLTATDYDTTISISGTGLTDLGSTPVIAPAGDKLIVNDGFTTKSFVYKSDSGPGDTSTFKSIDDLNTKLAALGVKAKAESDGGKLKLTATDYTTTLTVTGTAGTKLGGLTSPLTATGATLTVNDGFGMKSFVYNTDSAPDDTSSFKDIADLNAKLIKLGVKAKAEDAGGKLKLSATDNMTTLTVGGSAQTGLGLTSVVVPSTGPSGLEGKSMTFTTQNGDTTTITFGDPANTPGTIKTLDDMNTQLAKIGLSASLDGNGNFSFATTMLTASQTFSISGSATGPATSFAGLVSSTPTRGGTGADTRDGFVVQYNNLLTQIDTLAKDAGFNGINLLAGDTLSMIFNETNTSRLDIAGTSASSSGLGLTSITAANFADGNATTGLLNNLERVSSQLQTQASRLGSQLAVTQTRQDFTKQMVNTLKVGADNLVNADLNEEGANLLALNTQQQLSQQALSLATQSAQSVLQLLRG